jgi:hypothetical protein
MTNCKRSEYSCWNLERQEAARANVLTVFTDTHLFRLDNSAREPVEDETVGAVRALERVLNEPNHDLCNENNAQHQAL